MFAITKLQIEDDFIRRHRDRGESLEKPVSNCTFAFKEYFIINMVVASKFMESKHSYQRDCDFFQIEIGSK